MSLLAKMTTVGLPFGSNTSGGNFLPAVMIPGSFRTAAPVPLPVCARNTGGRSSINITAPARRAAGVFIGKATSCRLFCLGGKCLSSTKAARRVLDFHLSSFFSGQTRRVSVRLPPTMKLFPLFSGLICALLCSRAFAADTKSAAFAADQKAITAKVIDKDIEEIKALKTKYPELEHFGEGSWFTRGEQDFRYDYKTEPVPSPQEDHPVCKALPGGCGMYFRLFPTEGDRQ